MKEIDKKSTVRGNRAGNTLESTIIGTLTSKGLKLVPYQEWKRHPENFENELLLKNVPYETIYGHKGVTEFLVKSKKYNIEARIECKWQHSAGSVDEKFPYLYLNCVYQVPEKNIIIVIDGDGAKIGAINWIKNASQQKYLNQDKEITVMNLKEFLIWANATFV